MRYKINGVTMPPIVDFSYKPNNLYGENTGRDESGDMHLDLIKAGLHKWTIKHHMITRGELDQLEQALDPLGFTFTGFTAGGMVSRQCYGTMAGDPTCIFYEDDSPAGSWWACTVTFTQMR